MACVRRQIDLTVTNGGTLQIGACPSTCIPAANPAPHVCPLGFWGLRKVIERHVHDPSLNKEAKILAEPEAGRDVLALKGKALLAVSEQVPRRDHARLKQGVQSAWSEGVNAAPSWEAWKKEVKSTNPVLIVALPHGWHRSADQP